MATELAKAYVQIIPSAQGIQGSISDVLGGEADSAGKESGKKYASGLGSSLKKALVGVGIAKVLKDAIGNASEFETAMAKTSTLFTGDAKAFSALKNEILGLSSEYGLAATTLAEAAYSAESAGVKAEQLGPMLEGSARLAVAGFTDIDTALSATAKTMNAYGDAAMSVEDIQKVLIQTQNLGITTVGELGASLANVTPTAAAMGVGFDQVGAAMAQMTASGVQTAQATTQLRAAMTELGKSGTKADQAFREAAKGTQYAGMSFQEAQASGANLGDVFGLMQKYADATGVSMVDLWGSVEAGNAAMLIASDVETFNSNLEAMATDADVVGDAYGKMADTFGTSMNRLKESAKNFMTTLFEGGDISASFDSMLSSLGDVGEKLKTWLTNGLKTLGENLPKLVASLWDFGAGILQSLAEVDWISLGTTIINGIIGALGTLGKKLIELVSGAIKAVTNGSVDFGSIGTAIWNGVTSIITTAGGWLKELFETAKNAICGEDGIDFSGIGTSILNGVKSILDGAGNFLKELFGFGRDAASGEDMGYSSIGTKILDGVKSVLDEGGKFLGNLFDKGLDAAEKRPWPTVGEAIKTGVNLVLNGGKFLGELFSAGAELIKSINWSNVGQHVEKLIVSGLNGARKLVETVSDAANKLISSVDWSGVGQKAGDLLKKGIEVATKLVDVIGKSASALLTGVDWSGIGRGAGELVKTGLNGAMKLVDTVANSAQKLLSGVNWSNIGQKAGELLCSAIGGATKIVDVVSTAANDLITGVPWNSIGQKAGGLLEKGLEGASKVLETGFKGAVGFIQGVKWDEIGASISGALSEAFSGLGDLLGGALSGAGSALEGGGQFLGKGFKSLGDLLFGSDDLNKSVEDLQKAMTDLKKAVTDGKKEAEEAAKEVSKAIMDGLKSELKKETIDNFGNNTGKALSDGISKGISQNKSTLRLDIEGVRNTMVDTFKMESKWTQAGTYIINKIKSGMDSNTRLNSTIDNLITDLCKKFQDNKFYNAGRDIISALISGIQSQAFALMMAAATQAATIVNTFSAISWVATGRDIITSIVGGLYSSAGSLTTVLGILVSYCRSYAGNMLYAFDLAWNAKGSEIVRAIANGVYSAASALSGAFGTLTGYCSSAANAMYSAFNIGWYYIGYNIVDGIVSGVNSRSGALYNAMYKLAETAMWCAKQKLGISSPSKVMRDEVGRWIPAGIAAGINEYAGLVDNAMDDLADLNLTGVQSSLMDQTMGLMYGAGTMGGTGSDFVEDITQGVTDANEEQNQLLREGISLLRQIMEKETTVRVGASVGLGRTVRQSLDMYDAVGG